MRRSTSRWIVGGGIGAIIHIGVFWMVGVFTDSEEPRRQNQEIGAIFQFIGSDSEELSPIMKEQIVLFDPKPLMKPTRWNGANLDPSDLKEDDSSALFADYYPMFASESGDFVGEFGNSWKPASEPRQVQLDFPVSVTERFGRVAFDGGETRRASVGVEIVEVGSGETVYSRSLYNNEALELMATEEGWESVEFLAQVVDSFVAGTPMTVTSSRFPELDRELGELARRELLPKGLLRNGSYLVRISR